MTTFAERRARLDALKGPARPPTLERLLTSLDYFGLTTATPLQRAICRIADGLPLGEFAEHPHVIAAIGDVAALPLAPPKTLLLLAGIRSAKSMLAAAACIRQSQRVDVSQLKAGEVPRVSCVSVRLDQAAAVKEHLVGNLLSRPKLRELLLDEPKADSVILRHPSGRPVEVKVVAGSAAGATLISRWSAGVVFDEAPRMVGSADGVVNLDDMTTSIAGRMLPGAIIWKIGSPWAPFGPVFEDVKDHHGHPTSSLIVVRAKGSWMNPQWWTPQRIAELRASDPRAAKTDEDCQFTDPEEALFGGLLEPCTRAELVEEPRQGHEYAAAMDPATRGNAWTLVVATRREGKRIVVLSKQWQGSSASPLDPRVVLLDIRNTLRPYRLATVETDQWSSDALRSLARSPDIGLQLVEWPMTQAENTDAYLDLARRCALGEVELPPDPELITDLRRVKKRTTQNAVAIELPVTSDGRHCDYAPSVVRALRRYVAEPRTPETEAVRGEREALEVAKERWAPRGPQPTWRRKP